jgi:SAM-dependent methyltransferase
VAARGKTGREHLHAPEYADDVWRTRRDVASDQVIPWLSQFRRLSDSTVLEYGCGTGAVSCAFAPVVRRHIGYDIDAAAIALAQEHVRQHDADNVELRAVGTDEIFDAVREHRGEPNIVLLYAVIEHMTVSERLELLEVAREIVTDDGLIVVVETPNRLVWPDWHTSFLPFLSQLPDELAVAYADRSPRDDFREALRRAVEQGQEAGLEALTRWGRGASFHEFELVFGDLTRHVLAGGFDPVLSPERAVRWEELALARELERVRPDIAPAFGRYWIDLILSVEPVDPAGVQLIWPWTLETRLSPGARWNKWDSIDLDPGVPLLAELPCPSRRFLTTTTMADPGGTLTLEVGGQRFTRTVAGEPQSQITIDFELPVQDNLVSVTVDRPTSLHFLGYEAPACRPGIS